MPLSDRQITDLARALDSYLGLPDLIRLADEIGANLGNLAPTGPVRARAEALLKSINSARPPRDREFLEAIARRGPGQISAALQTLANQLLKPTYQPPVARDAVLLGRTGFFGREELRQGVTEFVTSGPYSSHVLIVEGNGPGGKTYSWEYLRHRAVDSGAVPRQLRLVGTTHDPRSLVQAVGLLLRLDVGTLPPLADQPQGMRMGALLAWFQGQLEDLAHPYWLVIDDLNDAAVTPEVRGCAYALATAVEQVKPDNLWLALLGYSDPITDPGMRNCIRDTASFPTPDMFADDFVSLANESPAKLDKADAVQYAQLLFSKYPAVDRAAMEKLTADAERLGQKLLLGQRP